MVNTCISRRENSCMNLGGGGGLFFFLLRLLHLSAECSQAASLGWKHPLRAVFSRELELNWRCWCPAAGQRCLALVSLAGPAKGQREAAACSARTLHSCALPLSSEPYRWGTDWKSEVFAPFLPGTLGIGWCLQSLPYHRVTEITQVMLFSGINHFWLYFAGLESKHIFFNWGGEINIELTQRISSVTTAIQIWRALNHWPAADSRRTGGENTAARHCQPGAPCLTARQFAFYSVTFPPEIATTSPSFSLLQEARKEDPSFHLAGCVLRRWLLHVDGAKYEKWRSCGSRWLHKWKRNCRIFEIIS